MSNPSMWMPLLAAWLFVGACVYVATDPAQKFLYDGVAPGLWWRSIVGSLPIAALIYLLPVRLDEMFTVTLYWTILHCVIWFLVFWLLCGYSPPHAAIAGPVGFLLLGWAASMIVDNLSRRPLPTGLTG